MNARELARIQLPLEIRQRFAHFVVARADMQTRNAIAPRLVRRETFPAAAALTQLVWQVGMVAGPLLAGVVVYMWWDLLHERPDRAGRQQEGAGGASTNGAVASTNATRASNNGAGAAEAGRVVPRYRDDEDEELAAYNRYLAELNARPANATGRTTRGRRNCQRHR